MTLKEFLEKHGAEKLGKLVGEFILKSPDFAEGNLLAKQIGAVVGDLDYVFKEEIRRQKSDASINFARRTQSVGPKR